MTAGSKLGRYELLARLATGGMGEIFLARLEGAAGFEKLCVIKRILPHLADDARFRAMLVSEARIASNASHANICHVYELGESDHQLYMVMEYLEGVTLLELLRVFSRRGLVLDYGCIAGIVQQICEGLHYAHELRDRNGEPYGIVHRDITPSNLYLTRSGVAKIVDFGIAKVKAVASTESGTIKGKYAYMAPEQLRGKAVDRRVDVFALGVVIAEMLTSRRLFQRKTDYLTFRAVLEQPIEIHRYRPDVPVRLAAVLERALQRDPEVRYATVRQLWTDLLEALGDIRPWGHGQISELVTTTFADRLALEDAAISNIVKCESAPGVVPLLSCRAHDTTTAEIAGEVAIDDDDDASSYALQVEPPQRTGVDGNAPRTQVPSTRMRQPRRLAIAVILVAAAGVLVTGLVLAEPAGRQLVEDRASPAVVVASDRVASATGAPGELYARAIRGRASELDQCAHAHLDGLPDKATVVVHIGVDGRVKSVVMTPERDEWTKLGGCIRDVLRSVAFPGADDDKELALALHRSEHTSD